MLSFLPEDIKSFCQKEFGNLVSFNVASGGCINHGGKLETSSGIFFIKWNTTFQHKGMFEAERKGLNLLASTQSIFIPKVRAVFEGTEHSCIIMDNVEPGACSSQYNEELAYGLAKLHQTTNDHFGLDHNNYMGSLAQVNSPRKNWIDFYRDCRLSRQLKLAEANNHIDATALKKFERLMVKLSSLLVSESPSLIHGDLWSGNVITTNKGLPCLIDPAVAYAHREVDLAMTQLFGGFDNRFYTAYQEAYPTENGLAERIEIYKLYPLLVHVNLFGGGYLSQTMSIVNQFV